MVIREKEKGNRTAQGDTVRVSSIISPASVVVGGNTYGLFAAEPSDLQSCAHCLRAPGRRSEGTCEAPGNGARGALGGTTLLPKVSMPTPRGQAEVHALHSNRPCGGKQPGREGEEVEHHCKGAQQPGLS